MIESLFSMQDKMCVVMGGSRGLGAFMVQGFLESGAKRVSPDIYCLAMSPSCQDSYRAIGCLKLPVAA